MDNSCFNASFFCPEGSSTPTSTSTGFYAIATKVGRLYNQSECEAGQYCVSGYRQACRAGRFGNVSRSVDPECSGECERGYYCGGGSTSPRQEPCGSAMLYCPQVWLVCCLHMSQLIRCLVFHRTPDRIWRRMFSCPL